VGSVAIPENHELHRPILPPELRANAEPLGVRGVVVIEVSANVDENRWLLELADSDPFVLALIGNLNAGTPGFAERLAAYARDPRFRGIRSGTPWCPLDLGNPRFVADLELLAAAGLTLDVVAVGGGGPALLQTTLDLAERIPSLKIVIDHLPYDLPDDASAHEAYARLLKVLAARPHISAKLSNILPRNVAIPDDPAFYKRIVDELLALFGPDRLMYGSNWPVSALVAPYSRALRILLADFATRDPALAEKFFSANVRQIYGIP
jgi:L-fuconolactonase